MTKAEEYSRVDHELVAVKVIDNVEISPGVFLISWRQKVVFIPGQVVKVAIDRLQPPRIYSVCCGNLEEKISILFNIKDEGYLTPRLAEAIPGDELLVSNPYGSFHGDHTPAFWIATGTGIAPFYSMFQSGMFDHKILIHGARYLNQFYFEDELEWALGDDYIRCCSREASCNVFTGRITNYLLETNHFPKDYKYYLCGKSLMVVEVRDLLISKGIPYENIFAEIYF
jgi:ferredoxin/flavodoxin---NADP+ reductase